MKPKKTKRKNNSPTKNLEKSMQMLPDPTKTEKAEQIKSLADMIENKAQQKEQVIFLTKFIPYHM